MTTLLLTNRYKADTKKLIIYCGAFLLISFLFVVVYLKAFDHSPKWVESAGLPYDAVLSNQNKNLKYDKETGALIWPDSLEVVGMSSYIDTTKPTAQDTIKMQQAFLKKFNDTATFGRFRIWLYERISAKDYNNFLNITSQYYNAYLRDRYDFFVHPLRNAIGTNGKQ